VTSASLRTTSPLNVKADALVIGVQSAGDDLVPALGSSAVADAWGKGFGRTLKDLGASSKAGEVCKLPGGNAVKAPVLLVVGLGAEGTPSLDVLRKSAGAAARALAGKGTVAYALPATTPQEVHAVSEGALLGAYAYDSYLTKKHQPIGEVVVLTEIARAKEAKSALATAITTSQAVNFCRDLVNMPPNDLYPDSFAD
jgi:leucyl aminopeptidase